MHLKQGTARFVMSSRLRHTKQKNMHRLLHSLFSYV